MNVPGGVSVAAAARTHVDRSSGTTTEGSALFFLLSKVLWIAAAPTNLMIAALLLGCGLLARRVRQGWHLVFGAAAALFICGVLPVGTLLLLPLEDRFPVPDLDNLQPSGIIVLGGAIDQVIGAARGQVSIVDAATRLTQGAVLARRFPRARLIYTGGSNALLPQTGGEAEDARRLWEDLGVEAGRITLEDKSRNTYENAIFTHDLLHPQSDGRWLLVTSAFHMPRAAGLFRAAGFPVIPYPVDYRTTGTWRDFQPNRDASIGLTRFDFALREWIGLAAYRLSGRTAALFPGP